MNSVADLANTDALLLKGWPAGIYSPEQGWNNALPTILIYASCHGRTLADYFRMKQDFRRSYNVMRLETGPLRAAENDGVDIFNRPSVRAIFQATDILLTYNMGPRHGSMSLERIMPLLRKDCRVITWTAPNFSAFSPVNSGYCGGLGVLDAMNKGKTGDEIVQSFFNDEFDPMYGIRWHIEIGRLEDRDSTHDVKLADLILKHHKTHKLFMGASHPSMTAIAHMGSQMLSLLGHPSDTEETILGYNYMEGALEGDPETDYEFRHYGFTYPQRHKDTRAGGKEVYEQLIRDYVAFFTRSGHFSIPTD